MMMEKFALRSRILLAGAAMFELARREFKRQWGETQEEIEKEIKRKEAAV